MVHVDLSLNGLLNGNVFNFLILVLIFAFIFVKFNVSSVLDNAVAVVIALIKKSDDDKLNSEKTLEDANKEIEKLPLEMAKINEDSQNALSSYKKAAQLELEETERFIQDAEAKALATEELRRLTELKKNVAEKAVEYAQNNAKQVLKQDLDKHRKLISESLAKLEGIEI